MPTVAESYGKQLAVNNAADQINNVIQDLRHQPILDLLFLVSPDGQLEIVSSAGRCPRNGLNWGVGLQNVHKHTTSNAWNLPCNVLFLLLRQWNMLRTKQKCIQCSI
jgi:hypothetical protein